MKNALLLIALLIVIAMTTLWVRHGGGTLYSDLNSTPQISSDALETVLNYPEPIGNVAVSSSGRLFFTVHPESRTTGNKLLEFVDGASVPFPSLALQDELFDTPLGLVIDRFDRLWVIDHGNHGARAAHIVAIDLVIGDVIRNQNLGEQIAPLGSFLQDLQVSADGQTIVVADASFWRKSPGLIVYDIETGNARRVLDGHESVSAENYVIETNGRKMAFLGGAVALRGGVDGIALGPEWLYYGALSGSGLWRVRLEDLRNEELPAGQLANRAERFSDKPLSDGFSIDKDGGVYLTDIEHASIFRIDASKKLQTLIQSPKIRWPDGLSFGPDGYLYLADSALPELILKSHEHIKAEGPYQIYRFEPGHEGVPGQ